MPTEITVRTQGAPAITLHSAYPYYSQTYVHAYVTGYYYKPQPAG